MGTPFDMTRTRPNAWQWLRYAYGARLPDRYREWVLRDATDSGWLWRFAFRVIAQTAPWLMVVTVLLLLFTPLPIGWVLGADAIALGMSLYFTLTSADELTEARLVKHGFRAGTGKATRAGDSSLHG
jgi:hypothetical protein